MLNQFSHDLMLVERELWLVRICKILMKHAKDGFLPLTSLFLLFQKI